ncbi:MAG: extracellular solute-binding protein [Hyphomicrobiales bacterium]|nr:extracellular solute-binding protein [Hyphomicrobiales bacterium]
MTIKNAGWNPRTEALGRRRFLQGSAAVAAVTVLWRPQGAEAAEELNILVWCDHADRKLLEPFEKMKDAQINVKDYEGTGTALAVIEQSAPGDWDVFVVDSPDAPRVARLGLLAELSDDDVPWTDMFPQFREAPHTYVDGKLYAVPEKFGYYGIAYNKDKVDPADMAKADVMWNEKYKGRMAVYDYYFPIIQMVALTMNIVPAEISLENLPGIREKLLAMKPNVALVGDIVGVQNALVTGDADLIVGGAEYSVSGLMTDNPEFDWVISDAGGLIWSQGLAVFADSRKKDLATDFVKYVISPEGQARLATSDCYWAMPTNAKAPLTDAQKKILRWDQQQGFIARSYPSFISEADLDVAMLDIWNEFLQA